MEDPEGNDKRQEGVLQRQIVKSHESLHAQRDAVAAVVYLDDPNADVLMEFHHISGMGDATVGHL